LPRLFASRGTLKPRIKGLYRLTGVLGLNR
jgi:hypothetical protein